MHFHKSFLTEQTVGCKLCQVKYFHSQLSLNFFFSMCGFSVWFEPCSQGTFHVWHIARQVFIVLKSPRVCWCGHDVLDKFLWVMKSVETWCLPSSLSKFQLLLRMVWDIFTQCPLSVHGVSPLRPHYNRLHVILTCKHKTCGLSLLSQLKYRKSFPVVLIGSEIEGIVLLFSTSRSSCHLSPVAAAVSVSVSLNPLVMSPRRWSAAHNTAERREEIRLCVF